MGPWRARQALFGNLYVCRVLSCLLLYTAAFGFIDGFFHLTLYHAIFENMTYRVHNQYSMAAYQLMVGCGLKLNVPYCLDIGVT